MKPSAVCGPAVFAMASLLTGTYALALEGAVTDEAGNPIANATITLIDSKSSLQTNQLGEFEIGQHAVDEIHIEADGYNHRVLHLHGEHTDEPLTIILTSTLIEQVDVIGLPIHASTLESVQPISVLSGDNLRNKQASTLGETLNNEIGIHTSYFGPNTSSPIIRGLDGPRVLITQNGLDVSDASRVGPDHAVTSEASTAEQIEILRGPSTLFYGSGAIGGVINIVDDRVPSDNLTKAAVNTSFNSVSNEKALSAAYTGGSNWLAVHIDGFWRENDDYTLPSNIDHSDHHQDESAEEHQEHRDTNTLANSAASSQGFNLGGSWLLDSGYIGLSYGRMERLNGIPGHGVHSAETDADHAEEAGVQSDLEQDRWQLISELNIGSDWLSAINTRVGYTHYQHTELHAQADTANHQPASEHDDTVFRNKSLQLRADIVHQELRGWRGALSLENKSVDFEAIGAEAFTSPSTTNSVAIALVEEKHTNSLLWQLGARIENIGLSADPITVSTDQHQGETLEAANTILFDDLSFTPFSVSAGAVWDFTAGYNTSVSLTHAQRAPSAGELFSVGPHLGTGVYEIGALFEIHQQDDEYHLDYHGDARTEASNNVDLSLRKFEGNIGYVINAFYNQVNDFYFQANTGLSTEDLFVHEEADIAGETEHHEEPLPVYIFQQRDARFYGLEAEFIWQPAPLFQWTLWSDSIHSELNNGDPLPRIPPMRIGNEFVFEHNHWFAELSATYVFEQTRTAENETPTDDYTMLDAIVSYSFDLSSGNITVYGKGGNLLDTEARIHSSFMKSQAPLPGRGFSLGIRGEF